jgi:hypothetical protein
MGGSIRVRRLSTGRQITGESAPRGRNARRARHRRAGQRHAQRGRRDHPESARLRSFGGIAVLTACSRGATPSPSTVWWSGHDRSGDVSGSDGVQARGMEHVIGASGVGRSYNVWPSRRRLAARRAGRDPQSAGTNGAGKTSLVECLLVLGDGTPASFAGRPRPGGTARRCAGASAVAPRGRTARPPARAGGGLDVLRLLSGSRRLHALLRSGPGPPQTAGVRGALGPASASGSSSR